MYNVAVIVQIQNEIATIQLPAVQHSIDSVESQLSLRRGSVESLLGDDIRLHVQEVAASEEQNGRKSGKYFSYNFHTRVLLKMLVKYRP